MATPSDLRPTHQLVLYDGVCGLCNRFVQFLLPRDRHDRLRFASLQSSVGRALLTRHGRDPEALDTVYLVVEPTTERERLLTRGRAALAILRSLGGGWRALALFRIVPTVVLDALYRFVARNRYRWFGKLDACPLAAPEQRGKFIVDDAS